MFYIGLDLGTSALKGLLVDECGKIVREACAEYPVCYPRDGWSEQDPEHWLKAAVEVLDALSNGVRGDVRGVSIGGQMHGLVLLGERDEVIRPAILWNDGRAQAESDALNASVGRAKLSEYTANISFAGFTAPKLLWVKEHEPQNFARIRKLCLPKDYLAYKLTGVFSTDYSDASGMLFLDVRNKKWSREMLALCSAEEKWLPTLYESYAVTGKLLQRYGLPNAVLTAGAGDNAAAAVGTGTVKGGDCNISLGTSGTVFIAGDAFSEDGNNALHSFCHANGKWHLMGCILSAASCNRWWLETILGSKDYRGAVDGAALGENNVFFLPYLMGERSPHNDADARGAFIGMRANTTRQEMSLSVLEGVSFALRDCVEAARKAGIGIARATVCGGGAKSRVWREILANVLNCAIVSPVTEQGPAYGAAILAMVGSGLFPDVETAAKQLVRLRETVLPRGELVRRYEQKYEVFTHLYPALRTCFGEIQKR